jgi:hypothetical protein
VTDADFARFLEAVVRQLQEAGDRAARSHLSPIRDAYYASAALVTREAMKASLEAAKRG